MRVQLALPIGRRRTGRDQATASRTSPEGVHLSTLSRPAQAFSLRFASSAPSILTTAVASLPAMISSIAAARRVEGRRLASAARRSASSRRRSDSASRRRRPGFLDSSRVSQVGHVFGCWNIQPDTRRNHTAARALRSSRAACNLASYSSARRAAIGSSVVDGAPGHPADTHQTVERSDVARRSGSIGPDARLASG